MTITHALDIAGTLVPLVLKRAANAKRLSLRINAADQTVVLTLPKRATVDAALRFAEANRAWVAAHLAALSPVVPFVPGAIIPLLGDDHELRPAPDGSGPHRGGHERRPVRREDGALWIAGDPAHFDRRVRDYLIAEARRVITPEALRHARRIDCSIARITLRDPKSRWGSCSRNRRLSFSWRLIFCPFHVLDYIVAHEVAHLSVFDHSERFWALVDQLTPDAGEAKAWLRRHGASLHRYG